MNNNNNVQMLICPKCGHSVTHRTEGGITYLFEGEREIAHYPSNRYVCLRCSNDQESMQLCYTHDIYDFIRTMLNVGIKVYIVNDLVTETYYRGCDYANSAYIYMIPLERHIGYILNEIIDDILLSDSRYGDLFKDIYTRQPVGNIEIGILPNYYIPDDEEEAYSAAIKNADIFCSFYKELAIRIKGKMGMISSFMPR